jgi:prephenate dehydrogenase
MRRDATHPRRGDALAGPLLDKVVVIGVGLIGGSFALALKHGGGAGIVVGVGRTQTNLDDARRLGIADRTVRLDGAWTTELRDADLVLVATPVGQMAALFEQMAPHLGASTVVTDAGSTKQDVIAAARAGLGSAIDRFVPAHPIAGAEHSGATAAYATLFRGKIAVVTPVAETRSTAVDRVKQCWLLCDAVVRTLAPARHDAIFAAVSHLPHALAFAQVAELAARPDADEFLAYAASGFRDFTRLASSSPEMWRDIFVANRAALRDELNAYQAELARLDAMLAAGDEVALLALLTRARDARDAWLAAGSCGGA